jgi:hypothetical protein
MVVRMMFIAGCLCGGFVMLCLMAILLVGDAKLAQWEEEQEDER